MDIVAEREKKIEWVASQILCVIKTFFRENIDWDQVNGGHLNIPLKMCLDLYI